MIVQLKPNQILLLLDAVKHYALSSDISLDEQDDLQVLRGNLESVVIDALESVESKAQAAGFDKWVKSETNKIQGLAEELKKINETVPAADLLKKFSQVSSKSSGRPKKNK